MADPVITPALISAAAAAATAAATTTTTLAVNQVNSDDDAYIATVLNLSKFSFKVTPDTGDAVRGSWMQPLGDLTSLYDLIQEHPDTTKEDIAEIVKALGSGPHGLRPWSTGTMAKAGGLWGPAGVHCYDVYDETGKFTGNMVVLMMLIRPNWDYTAGVAMGRKDYIMERFDPTQNNSWDLYKAIEDGGNALSDKFDDYRYRKKFSDGENTNLKQLIGSSADDPTAKGALNINFHPAKSFIYRIEDTPF